MTQSTNSTNNSFIDRLSSQINMRYFCCITIKPKVQRIYEDNGINEAVPSRRISKVYNNNPNKVKFKADTNNVHNN